MFKFHHPLGLGLLVLAVHSPLLAADDEQIVTNILPGLVMAAKVRGKVYFEFNGESFRVRKKSRAVQGVVVNAHLKSSVVLLMANGTAISLQGPAKLKIERFLVEATNQPPVSSSRSKTEPESSSSDTLLRLFYGDIVIETKVLRKNSSFIVQTPFGNVSPIPNDYGFKTLFRIRYSEDYPMLAVWEGIAKLTTPQNKIRIIARDEQLFIHPQKGLLLAPGLTPGNIRRFEQTQAQLQNKPRFRWK